MEAGSNDKYFKIMKENRTHTSSITGKITKYSDKYFLEARPTYQQRQSHKIFHNKKVKHPFRPWMLPSLFHLQHLLAR